MSNSVESLILSHFLRLRFFFIHRFIHIIHIFHKPSLRKIPAYFSVRRTKMQGYTHRRITTETGKFSMEKPSPVLASGPLSMLYCMSD